MLLFFSSLIFAQPDNELRQGMWALNGWATANMVSSIPRAFDSDATSKAYHQMNIGWNVINAGLATHALLSQKPIKPKRMAQIFWINAGLDILYMTGGYILRQRGINTQNPQWVGWGESIMVQGGFLFVFDGIMGWRMQRWHTKQHFDPEVMTP